MDDLTKLIKESKAEQSDSIPDFVENGADVPNSDLRKVATLNSHEISESTAELLRELHSQNSYEGGYAFRVYHARPEAAEKLVTPGTHIADFGVQCASIHLEHAEGWGLDHPDEATKRIILVLDKDVPKKNISTGFLMDHVVVLPGEVLKVSESVVLADTTYVMLKAAQQDHQPVYSPFDGTEYDNFPDKKAYLTTLRE